MKGVMRGSATTEPEEFNYNEGVYFYDNLILMIMDFFKKMKRKSHFGSHFAEKKNVPADSLHFLIYSSAQSKSHNNTPKVFLKLNDEKLFYRIKKENEIIKEGN